MKFPHFSGHLRRACALMLAAALAVPAPVFASQGKPRLETTQEILKGLTYINAVSEHAAGRVESFTLELDDNSKVFPIILQSSGTVYDTASVSWAVSRAQEMGYNVVAAVNTDFFSSATGVPAGIVIEDGVYKSEADGNPALLVVDEELQLCTDTTVSLTLTNETTGAEIVPNYFNKYRASTGGVYLLNRDFSTVSTRTSTPGWFVRMEIVDYEPDEEDFLLTVNSELELEVTELVRTDKALTIGEGEYILTADDNNGMGSIFAGFQLGDRITLKTECEDDDLSDAQWAGGVGDILVEKSKVTSPAQWEDVKQEQISSLRAPRTALGVRKDGTAVIYAVDGRQSKHSVGLTLTDLANEMDDRNCQWAVNLDGGGSTTMSIWVPGQKAPSVQNSPSDGKARACATYLLLVTEKGGNGKAESLAFTENLLTVLTNSSMTLPEAVVLDSGLNVLNKDLKDLTVSASKGKVEDGVYHAKKKAGTDTLRLRSRRLGASGEMELNVVDKLTSLCVTADGGKNPITTLSVKRGQTIQLDVTGEYFGRTALHGYSEKAVEFDVDKDNASVDKNALLTITEDAESCVLTVEAGGLKQKITLNVHDPHTDVPEDHFAYDAVEYCYQNGIVSGTSDTTFGPEGEIRRADFMLMLYAALGRPEVTTPCTFTDVSESDYYYTALAWAQANGLISGSGDGSCMATAPITREQSFTILRQALRPLGKQCEDASVTLLEDFADLADLADYAKYPTATLVSQGIISFADEALSPKANLTRAEMAVLLYNICTMEPVTDYPTAAKDVVVPEQPAVTPELPAQPEQPAETPEQPAQNGLPLESLPAGAVQAVVEGADTLNVRSGPGTEHEVLYKLKGGPQVLILSRDADWYQILYRTEEGTYAVGYASADYIVPTSSAGVINAEPSLNIRTGPGTDYDSQTKLPTGTNVIVAEKLPGWLRIVYLGENGQLTEGYTSADYVTISE